MGKLCNRLLEVSTPGEEAGSQGTLSLGPQGPDWTHFLLRRGQPQAGPRYFFQWLGGRESKSLIKMIKC